MVVMSTGKYTCKMNHEYNTTNVVWCTQAHAHGHILHTYMYKHTYIGIYIFASYYNQSLGEQCSYTHVLILYFNHSDGQEHIVIEISMLLLMPIMVLKL